MKEKLIIFILIFSLTVNVAALITMGYFWGKDYTVQTGYPHGGWTFPTYQRSFPGHQTTW